MSGKQLIHQSVTAYDNNAESDIDRERQSTSPITLCGVQNCFCPSLWQAEKSEYTDDTTSKESTDTSPITKEFSPVRSHEHINRDSICGQSKSSESLKEGKGSEASKQADSSSKSAKVATFKNEDGNERNYESRKSKLRRDIMEETMNLFHQRGLALTKSHIESVQLHSNSVDYGDLTKKLAEKTKAKHKDN